MPAFDVIVVGSGAAGLSTAIGLADNLMMVHALDLHGHPLIVPAIAPADIWHDLTSFEACVVLAADRATGKSD